MSQQKKAAILYRRSKHYHEPVVCGVFIYADMEIANRAITNWISIFKCKFPEFKDAEYEIVWADIFPDNS